MILPKKLISSLLISFIMLLSLSCKSSSVVISSSGAKLENITKTVEETTNVVKESSTKVGEGIIKIDETTNEINKEASNITNAANDIKNNVESAKDLIPAEVLEKINPKLDIILKSAEAIQESNKIIKDSLALIRQEKTKIDESIIRLESTIKELKSIRKETESLQARIVELEKERDQALQKYLNLLIIGGVLVSAAGIALLFFGNKSAIYLGIGGIVLVGVAVAVKNYSEYFALIGIGGLVIVIVGLVVQAYNMYKTKKAKKEMEEILAETEKEYDATDKALEETVSTVEAMKHVMDNEKQKEFFGEGALPGRVELLQSEETKLRVAKARQRNKYKWEHTIGSTIPNSQPDNEEENLVEKRRSVRKKKI